MTEIRDELIETRKILINLGKAFIVGVLLLLSSDITTVHCSKCGEAWKMFAFEITAEEKSYYVCPNCENTKYRR